MKSKEIGPHLSQLSEAARTRNTPSFIISDLVRHEGDHAREDAEGHGVFGLLLITTVMTIPEVVNDHIRVVERHLEVVAGAFYRPLGERSPEAMAKIASAPGFAEMSDQDWRVYKKAKREITDEQKFGPNSRGTIYPPKNEETSQEEYSDLPLAA